MTTRGGPFLQWTGGRFPTNPFQEAMEHRLEKRVPLDAEVLIWGRDRRVCKGRIRNANSEGIFIEFNGKPFLKGDTVTIELPGVLDTASSQMLGIVVHYSRRGIGVMIAPAAEGLLRHLRKYRKYAEAEKKERHVVGREAVALSAMKT